VSLRLLQHLTKFETLGDLRSQRHITSYFHTVINNNLQGTRNDEEEATLATQTLGS